MIGMKASAQRVSFVEPKEDPTITAGSNQVKIVINSNSDKLVMTHNMGEEKGVKPRMTTELTAIPSIIVFPKIMKMIL